ncbi:hypothetical protein V1463_05185 [Micrococcus yunnanensis]|nr:hypothetical protein [Micrococcus luteus]
MNLPSAGMKMSVYVARNGAPEKTIATAAHTGAAMTTEVPR